MFAFCERFVSVLSAFCQRFVSVLSAFCQRFVSVLSAFCSHLTIGVDILLLLLVGKYYLQLGNTNLDCKSVRIVDTLFILLFL